MDGQRWLRPFLVLALGSVGLAPFLATPAVLAASSLAGRTIVLNPEEGGSSSGGISGGVEEKTINLPTALDVGALLSQAGAHVVYTRSTDVTVSLKARAALANQVHADAFVTIAANALHDPNFSGSTTYYGQRSGYVGGQTRSANLLAASRDLAQDVQHGVVQATGAVDQGVQSATFYVLGYAAMPSILVETGFMTSPPELRQLVTPAYQETIAEGIASGLEQFFSGRPATTQAGTTTATAQTADATYVSDVTDPDGTVVSPGQVLTKTWQVTNSGVTAWDDTFSLVLQPGATLQAPTTVPLPIATPGQTVALSVPVTAPTVPGSADATWRLTTPDGQPFGDPLTLAVTVAGGSAAFTPFWIETTQPTTLWSAADPARSTLVRRLGQWSYLQVTGPQQGSRLPVTEPASQTTGSVTANAVGPAGPPPAGYTPPPAQPPFTPFWVETTQATPLSSGPSDPSTTFETLAQWSPLLVLAPQDGARLYVRDPATGGTAYVQAAAVGPSGPPAPTSPRAATMATVPAATATPALAYVVKVGDTLASISRAFGIRPVVLAQANGMSGSNAIVVGQTLQIPGGTPVFQPFWVANFKQTPLWSGTNGNAVQLGVAAQFTPLRVLAPEINNRYRVTVWTTGGQAYVATTAVGPVGPPKGAPH